MESARETLASEELSSRATDLISNCRGEGTLAHYKSAWRQWNSWCDIQHIDPFGASLSKVLTYLGVRFDKGLEYRTMNVHRTAISSKHALFDGVPVGQHPRVFIRCFS